MRFFELIEGKQHPVIVVDVQPAYESGFEDTFKDIINFVAIEQTGPVLMFVNADETGFTDDSINDIQQYWENIICPNQFDEYDDEYECNYKINWNRFKIVDKGYGYFRDWMDSGISDDIVIKAIRLLYQQKVSDTRDLFNSEDDDEYAIKFNETFGFDPNEYDSLSVEWTSVAQLKQFNGSYIVGGGRNECLREVELLMNAFNIKYKRIDRLVYG